MRVTVTGSLGIRELLHSNYLPFRSSRNIGNEEDSFRKHIIRDPFPKGPNSHMSSAKQSMSTTTQRIKGEQQKNRVSQKCSSNSKSTSVSHESISFFSI